MSENNSYLNYLDAMNNSAEGAKTEKQVEPPTPGEMNPIEETLKAFFDMPVTEFARNARGEINYKYLRIGMASISAPEELFENVTVREFMKIHHQAVLQFMQEATNDPEFVGPKVVAPAGYIMNFICTLDTNFRRNEVIKTLLSFKQNDVVNVVMDMLLSQCIYDKGDSYYEEYVKNIEANRAQALYNGNPTLADLVFTLSNRMREPWIPNTPIEKYRNEIYGYYELAYIYAYNIIALANIGGASAKDVFEKYELSRYGK